MMENLYLKFITAHQTICHKKKNNMVYNLITLTTTIKQPI